MAMIKPPLVPEEPVPVLGDEELRRLRRIGPPASLCYRERSLRVDLRRRRATATVSGCWSL